ncbi:cysteine proteinase 3, partial [Clonorchis sinensis]
CFMTTSATIVSLLIHIVILNKYVLGYEVYEWDVLLTANKKSDLIPKNKPNCIDSLTDHLNYTVHLAWEKFRVEFNRKYTDSQEQINRLNVFCQSFMRVREHNKAYEEGRVTFKRGINEFSDRFPDERQHACGGRINISKHSGSTFRKVAAPAPQSIDWRRNGAVTPVRRQGDCGACWAFAATGAIEGRYFIFEKRLETFSPQQLVDCIQGDTTNGCNGGYPSEAFEYVENVGGLELERDYPYVSVATGLPNPFCGYDQTKQQVKLTSHVILPSGDEEALLQAVSIYGPIAILFDASHPSFKDYESDIYSEENCGTTLDDVTHAMLVVGYGEELGEPYWLVKNSWGDKWGEKGYMRVRRGVNMCAVAGFSSYPLM